MAVNSFKQTMHPFVAAAQDPHVVGVCEVGHVGSNLKILTILQTLARNPIDNVIEEGREENMLLSNAEANLKGH